MTVKDCMDKLIENGLPIGLNHLVMTTIKDFAIEKASEQRTLCAKNWNKKKTGITTAILNTKLVEV